MSKRRIALVLALALLLFSVVLAISVTQVGVTSEFRSGGLPLSVSDPSSVPPSVAEDATRLATELFGESQEKYNNFTNQLLATYLEAKDKDFVVVFNPGGWGWSLVEASPGWHSIFTGMESELNSSGYTSLLLNYQRTVESLQGYPDEIVEMITDYSSKAEELAYRVEFLTTHIPDLRVIIAGESNGTVIADRVMDILKDNPQVYSIQTGPPFWHDNIMLDRTLVMTDNGIIPDSFSQGDFLTMLRASSEDLFGFPRAEDGYGKILFFARAPGHDYRWQYPVVYSKITDFLNKNFGIKAEAQNAG